MNYEQTVLLEKGMQAQQAAIPPDERCTECNWLSQVSVGCALTHNIYNTCSGCDGTGRKAVQERLEQTKRRLEELRAQYPYR